VARQPSQRTALAAAACAPCAARPCRSCCRRRSCGAAQPLLQRGPPIVRGVGAAAWTVASGAAAGWRRTFGARLPLIWPVQELTRQFAVCMFCGRNIIRNTYRIRSCTLTRPSISRHAFPLAPCYAPAHQSNPGTQQHPLLRSAAPSQQRQGGRPRNTRRPRRRSRPRRCGPRRAPRQRPRPAATGHRNGSLRGRASGRCGDPGCLGGAQHTGGCGGAGRQSGWAGALHMFGRQIAGPCGPLRLRQRLRPHHPTAPTRAAAPRPRRRASPGAVRPGHER
jgi:hypothetical protein